MIKLIKLILGQDPAAGGGHCQRPLHRPAQHQDQEEFEGSQCQGKNQSEKRIV